jgi:hypothetical protein
MEGPGEDAAMTPEVQLQRIEERLAKLETALQTLHEQLAAGQVKPPEPDVPWWQKISTAFVGDPVFAEMVELGKQYRQSVKDPKPAKAKRAQPTSEKAKRAPSNPSAKSK